MALRDELRGELLKSIWHAFTALDVDQCGKVSKSQLKVLSHNLCTVMKIPHDPVALEEHFKDDDEGPVSTQGYMPYLNKFILDKVTEKFNRQDFDRICWLLCSRKNLPPGRLLISSDDAFKIWCIFNFLSEDRYPLIMVTEEIEYFLRKLTEAMGGSWVEERFEDYRLELHSKQQCLNAWELIALVGSGHFSKGMDGQTLSMAVGEVYQELILDVLKQGYLMKKGHKRKNWTERWFVLMPNSISYYVAEDRAEKKGDIVLDGNCSVEPLQDKDGKKCLFFIKSSLKGFEISASDKKKKQEWMQAIQNCVTVLRQGRAAPHREARQKRRDQRQKQQAEQQELELRMKELQTANEAKQLELENMRKVRRRLQAWVSEEEVPPVLGHRGGGGDPGLGHRGGGGASRPGSRRRRCFQAWVTEEEEAPPGLGHRGRGGDPGLGHRGGGGGDPGLGHRGGGGGDPGLGHRGGGGDPGLGHRGGGGASSPGSQRRRR
ncbi:switch-associated protein 70b isoform X2 [Betta splendens]|uniref:Switch-associated protein 70 n=1 Tax=Betta splendens TaxID=158456 RepID=A0A9W2XTN3_BETSP|nr:switch-associated protein 70b isoform X2 [Betta splendens]